MSDSSIHYALLLVPALWLTLGTSVSLWAALRERRLRARTPTPLPVAAGHDRPATAAPLPSSPPLPSIEELVADVTIPPSEPPHRGHTRIGIGPPAPGSKAPGPRAQSQVRRAV